MQNGNILTQHIYFADLFLLNYKTYFKSQISQRYIFLSSMGICERSWDFSVSLELNTLSQEEQQNFLSDFGTCLILCLSIAAIVFVILGHLSQLEQNVHGYIYFLLRFQSRF